MANRCAGLQTIRPHLPAPAPTHAAHSTSSSWLHPSGRVTKRKPRPSTRRQTPAVTYVTAADPADFRRMVQEITGASSSSGAVRLRQQAEAAAAPASMLILPMLDTSAFLLDRAVAPREPEGNKSSSGCASHAMAAAAVGDDPSVLQQAQSFVSDFPTLESCWGI